MGIARILGLAALLTAGPLAAEGRIDIGFGTQGLVVEGFQPDPAGGPAADADIGMAACSGPQGRLVASGLASNLTRVVTIFLRADGGLDPDVGFGGKQSFALPAGRKDNGIGLCQPDGKPVIAYNLARSTDPAQPHHEMRLVRIDPSSGVPDASFGVGGSVRIDLDEELGFVTLEQRPLALMAGPDGDVLVMGSYRRSAQAEYGFVVRVTAAGSVEQTGTSEAAGSGARRFIGGGISSDIRLRAVGGDGATRLTPGRLIETEFAYPAMTLVVNTIDPAAPLVVPFAARALDRDTVAVAVAVDGAPAVSTSMSDRPRTLHRLPRPLLDGAPAILHFAQIAPTPDGGALFMGSLGSSTRLQAMYAAKLVGTPTGADVDRNFGSGGYTLVRPDAVAPVCQPARTFAFTRFTFWNGAPTAIGLLDQLCVDGDVDYDYAVLRLEGRLFGDGLESRYPVR